MATVDSAVRESEVPMNDSSKKFTVDCEVIVTDDDVWGYLEDAGGDPDKLKSQGYQFTAADWEETAKRLFEDDNFTYFDFKEVR